MLSKQALSLKREFFTSSSIEKYCENWSDASQRGISKSKGIKNYQSLDCLFFCSVMLETVLSKLVSLNRIAKNS